MNSKGDWIVSLKGEKVKELTPYFEISQKARRCVFALELSISFDDMCHERRSLFSSSSVGKEDDDDKLWLILDIRYPPKPGVVIKRPALRLVEAVCFDHFSS